MVNVLKCAPSDAAFISLNEASVLVSDDILMDDFDKCVFRHTLDATLHSVKHALMGNLRPDAVSHINVLKMCGYLVMEIPLYPLISGGQC